MSRTSETRTIGEFEVTTQKLPATRGSRLRFKLVRLLGPAASSLAPLVGKDGKLEELLGLDIAAVAPAIVALASQIDDEKHDALMLEILICTSVVADGPKGKIKFDLTSKALLDQAFDGDVDALWKTVMFALEVNLSGFFSGRGSPAPDASVTPAPSASI